MKNISKKEIEAKKPMVLRKSKYVASSALGCNLTSESICGSNIQVP